MPDGGAIQLRAGEMSFPSQVNCRGMVSPSLKALLFILNADCDEFSVCSERDADFPHDAMGSSIIRNATVQPRSR